MQTKESQLIKSASNQDLDNILQINNLSKAFGNIKAVNNISFSVKKGSFFAFLGQNGAGKSTTIKIITTLLKQDSGEVLLNGEFNETNIRKKIGVVFQENVLDGLLTVKENLYSRGVLYINNKVKLQARYLEIIKKLKLEDIEKQLFKTLSGGQKRRVEIARALFANPEILILDEPTTGLDPETRKMVWEILHQLRIDEKITIFLTTHYMEEAANADYVVIIHKGNIVARGSPSSLKEQYSKDYFKLVPFYEDSLISFLNETKKLQSLLGLKFFDVRGKKMPIGAILTTLL